VQGLITPSDADSVVARVGFCAFTKNARSTSRMPLRPPVQLAARRLTGRVIAVILCSSAIVAPGSARSARNAGYGAGSDGHVRDILCIHQEHSILKSGAAPTTGSVSGAPIRRPRVRRHSVRADDAWRRDRHNGAERLIHAGSGRDVSRLGFRDECHSVRDVRPRPRRSADRYGAALGRGTGGHALAALGRRRGTVVGASLPNRGGPGMGFLDRLRGKKPQSDAPSVPTSRAPLPPPAVPADHSVPEQAVQVTAMLYSGDETLEVVGESNYQRALRRIARVSDGSDIRHPIVAVLVPEPDNPYDENAIAVQIDGSVVGYLSRNDAVAYGPGLRALMADSGKYVALEGVAVGGGSNVIGVFLDHDPSDFGLIASGRPSTQRTAGAWDGEMRTGLSEAWLADADDDDYDLSWYNDLPEGDRAAIAQLRELLTSDPDPIDRHFQFAELEARLYRCRDLYDSALDEYDEACRLHDAEMEVICEAFRNLAPHSAITSAAQYQPHVASIATSASGPPAATISPARLAGVLSIRLHDTRSPSSFNTTTTERRRCKSIPTYDPI
jgi:hypothetical protein